ncbi:MAG: hypothetical protein ACQEQF_12205 [Bacillota bacterium]
MNKMQKMIKQKYKEIIKSDNGSSLYQIDLHIHTPASLNDYKFSNELKKDFEELNFNEIKKYAIKNEYFKENDINEFKTKFNINKKELTAGLIVKEAVRKEVNLIVVADHNTVNGYQTIKSAAEDIVKPNIPFEVLPGVEITVFGGYHLIAIFNPKKEGNNNKKVYKYESQWEEVKNKLNWSIEEGEMEIATSKSLLDTIEIVKDVGGITYIPHLDDYNCKGQTWIKVLNSNKLDLIGANNRNMLPHDKIDSDNLPIITDSDAHCIENIGKKHTSIKMQYPSFEHLKMSILEQNIRFKDNNKQPKNRIIGVALKEGFLSGVNGGWQSFSFNTDLNCIIGGRGVGKSTLIKYISDLFKNKITKKKYCFLGQAKYALIYFCIDNKIYCIKGEFKPVKNNYTGEWELEISKRNKKMIDIQDEVTFYKLNHNASEIQVNYLANKEKEKQILNDLKLESYYQTQIESIGKEADKVNGWFEKFVISQKNKFIKLKNQLKEKQNKFNNELREIFNSQEVLMNKITKIKDLYKDKTNIKNQQVELYKELIAKLNSILKGKIKIEINEEDAARKELINYFQSIIRDSNILNFSKRKMLLKHIDYFVKVPYFRLIILLIKEEWGKIKEETGFNLVQESNRPHEAIKWSGEKIIRLFKKVFFNNKLYLIKNKPINIRINLDVNSYKANGNSIYKPLSQLSYGQRAIAILAIILEGFTELGDTSPLIIDQPEDQLDNAYISNYLVENIRNIKGKRQIILTTHNSNIPIGGDAENVFCLKSNGESGEIYKKGSIDKSRIISFIIENMEGGKSGLEMRLKKYVTTNSVDLIFNH